MTSYDMVKGFAPMIREVVRTQRMPPWHADPHYGVWQNTRALTDDQRKLLVHWIEAGAPRGTGADPLLSVKPDTNEWKHGKPDLIVEVPAYDIPATGVIEYQYPRVKNPLGRDVWITAVEIHPGAKQAIHHIIAQDPVVLNGQQRGGNGGGNLGGFAPGMSPIVYPADTGVLFPKDADFVFQMHYTPNGQAVTDHSKVGFYFREVERSAEVSAAPDRADGLPLRDPAGREGVRHDDDARRSRATCWSTTSCRTRTCAASRER